MPQLVAQLDREALLDGQLAQRVREPVAQFLGTRRFLGREWERGRLQVLPGTRARGAAERVAGLAVGNPEYPGRGLRVAAKVSRAAPYDPERVIDDLLGEVVAPGEPRQEARQTAVVQVVELLERAPVAARHPLDELDLPRRGAAAARTDFRHVVVTAHLVNAPLAVSVHPGSRGSPTAEDPRPPQNCQLTAPARRFATGYGKSSAACRWAAK